MKSIDIALFLLAFGILQSCVAHHKPAYQSPDHIGSPVSSGSDSIVVHNKTIDWQEETSFWFNQYSISFATNQQGNEIFIAISEISRAKWSFLQNQNQTFCAAVSRKILKDYLTKNISSTNTADFDYELDQVLSQSTNKNQNFALLVAPVATRLVIEQETDHAYCH